MVYTRMMKMKLTGEGGKGSQRRNSNEKAYADNWEKIFGKSSHISKDTTRGGNAKPTQKEVKDGD